MMAGGGGHPPEYGGPCNPPHLLVEWKSKATTTTRTKKKMSTETTNTNSSTILSTLGITDENYASAETVSALSVDDRLAILNELLARTLVVTSKGLGLPSERKGGPRGTSDRVNTRQVAAQQAILELTTDGRGVTTKELQDYAYTLPRVDGAVAYAYHDIGVAAELLVASGVITETTKGRARTWTRTAAAA